MKAAISRVVNLLLYLSFCVQAGTGLFLALRPRGTRVLGWGRHEWGEVHTWVAYLLIALIALHLLLHWRWLVLSATQGHLWRLIFGLSVGLAIIGALLFLPA